MKIIDTHIHIWNLDKVEYSWLKGDTSILNRNYELSQLEEARLSVGVSSGVLVQAANSLEDTDWMLAVAEASDWIKGVVGWLPLEDPGATARLLEERFVKGGLLKGVRHLIHDEKDPRWLLQGSVMESLGLLEKTEVPYDLVGVLPVHIRTALEVAEKCPGLRMVFDHLNKPTAAGRGEWEELMKEAAKHENFYCKISGLGSENVEGAIGFVLEEFGVDRCFCGGDWPVSLLMGGYEETWAAYRAAIEKYTDEAEKVYSKNAERFYGL
ncbi:MAG: amidohydrolase [Bacteroidetes bacterium]|nr:amidohydrolase [Bacteroidota bacterium]